jgi:hypothetical protein
MSPRRPVPATNTPAAAANPRASGADTAAPTAPSRMPPSRSRAARANSEAPTPHPRAWRAHPNVPPRREHFARRHDPLRRCAYLITVARHRTPHATLNSPQRRHLDAHGAPHHHRQPRQSMRRIERCGHRGHDIAHGRLNSPYQRNCRLRRCDGIAHDRFSIARHRLDIVHGRVAITRCCVAITRCCVGITRCCVGITRRCVGITRRCVDTSACLPPRRRPRYPADRDGGPSRLAAHQKAFA